jgi:flagellar biosynthesis component FlhA
VALELSRQVAQAWKKGMDQGYEKVVLLCDSRLRYNLAEILSRSVKMLPVVAYDEIVLGTDVDPIETIRIETAGNTTLEPVQSAEAAQGAGV